MYALKALADSCAGYDDKNGTLNNSRPPPG